MRLSYNKTDLGKSFGLAVAIMMIAQLVLSLAFFPFMDAEGNLPDAAFWVMQALYTLCISSTAFVYAKLTRSNVFAATTMNQKPLWAHVGWGCLAVAFLIALMLPVNDWLMTLIEKTGLTRPSVDMPMQIVPMIFVACVLPSFTEEIVFRGTIAQTLAGNKNKLASLAIVGALFALFHMNPAQTIHQFVLGAFLALLVYRSGSVWTSVLVHFFNNIAAVVLTFVVSDETVFTQYYWIFVPVGLVGFAASIFGYIKTTQSRWNTDQPQEESPTQPSREKFSVAALVVAIVACAAMWLVSLFTK